MPPKLVCDLIKKCKEAYVENGGKLELEEVRSIASGFDARFYVDLRELNPAELEKEVPSKETELFFSSKQNLVAQDYSYFGTCFYSSYPDNQIWALIDEHTLRIQGKCLFAGYNFKDINRDHKSAHIMVVMGKNDMRSKLGQINKEAWAQVPKGECVNWL